MEQNYRTLIRTYETGITAQNKTSNILGVIKLALFALSVFSLIALCCSWFSLLWLLSGGIFAVLFITACIRHDRILESVAYQKELRHIAEKNLQRITGDWTTSGDNGEEYADPEHPYAMDLDIVGENSLFQYINCTNTYYGRKQLADDLLHPEYSDEEIRKRQEAIKELCTDYEWIADLEYLFSKIGRNDQFPKLLSELKEQNLFTKHRFIHILPPVLRTITWISILTTVVVRSGFCFALSGILLFFQLIIWNLGKHKTDRYLKTARLTSYQIPRYCPVIRKIAGRSFTSSEMKAIQAQLTEAEEGIRQFSRISSHIKATANPLASLLLNLFFLWDHKNAFDFEKWKLKYGKTAESWFSTIGELESLMSFAGLARNCDTVCLPTWSGHKRYFLAKQAGHPLLCNKKRVCNDFEMNDHIVIISGSNMSGKSTFMRTVGINLVLAKAGSYVCAEKMECSHMDILTSMRITDRTTDGISTFYSELLRIKKIIEAAETNKNVLFLIDEIFRGTNSDERRLGAEGVLQRLLSLGVCGFITTHDLEICKLEENHPSIVNYNFSEKYKEDEMYFDYQIKKGVSTTRNAEFLLRKVGILPPTHSSSQVSPPDRQRSDYRSPHSDPHR